VVSRDLDFFKMKKPLKKMLPLKVMLKVMLKVTLKVMLKVTLKVKLKVTTMMTMIMRKRKSIGILPELKLMPRTSLSPSPLKVPLVPASTGCALVLL